MLLAKYIDLLRISATKGNISRYSVFISEMNDANEGVYSQI